MSASTSEVVRAHTVRQRKQRWKTSARYMGVLLCIDLQNKSTGRSSENTGSNPLLRHREGYLQMEADTRDVA